MTCELPVETFRLANGLRVVMQPDGRVPLAALHICYRAGSRRDPVDRRGLAHLCEHLAAWRPGAGTGMAEGRSLARIGGVTNGVTSHDRTSFSAVLPSEHLPLALRLEARRMGELPVRPSPDLLETERRILLQERFQTVEGRPYGRSIEVLHRLLYPPEHPYHWPPAGLPEGILAIGPADVESHIRDWYVPAEAVLVLAGDFPPAATATRIERLFGVVPDRRPGGVVDARISPALPLGERERRERITDRVLHSRAYLAFRGPAAGDPSLPLAALWARSAGVGRSSLLRKLLVEESGAARDIQAYLLTLREASTVVLVATAAPGVSPERLTDSLVEAVDGIVAGGIPCPVMRRARKKALTDHYSVFQRLKPRTDLLAAAATGGPPLETRELYDRVTPEDLAAWARRSCRLEDRVILTVTSQEEGP